MKDIDEIEEKYTCKFTLFLDGIDCKEKEIEIYKNLKIRGIRDPVPSSNLEIKLEVIDSSSILFPLTELSGQFKSDKDCGDLSNTEIFAKIYIYPVILRLFRLGAVFLHSIVIEPFNSSDSKKERVIDMNYASLIKDRKVYEITEKDKQDLKKIMKILQKPVSDVFLPMSKEPVNHIFVALEMYNNAFLNIGPMEGRVRYYQSQIAFLISALEALYLTKVPIGSITRRLGQRVATVFKILGDNSLRSYKKITEAYTIRSNYYHSNVVSKKKVKEWNLLKDRIGNLSKDIFQFVRISILVFLELSIFRKSQKVEFLTLIDNSLLDEGKATELKIKIDKLDTKFFI